MSVDSFEAACDLAEYRVPVPFRYLGRSNAKVAAFAPMVLALVRREDLNLWTRRILL